MTEDSEYVKRAVEIQKLLMQGRSIRSGKGDSPEQAAAFVGVSRASITNWETERSFPTQSNLWSYLKYLLSDPNPQTRSDYPAMLELIERNARAERDTIGFMSEILASIFVNPSDESDSEQVLSTLGNAVVDDAQRSRLDAIRKAESNPRRATAEELSGFPNLAEWIIDHGGDPDACDPLLLLQGVQACQVPVYSTREGALKWVSQCHPSKQRTCRQAVWEGYGELMDNGEWKPTADSPLMYDLDGWARNFNHRAHAIAWKKSEAPIAVMVLNGCTEEMIQVLDKGVKRTDSDTLRGFEMSNSSAVAAITTRLMDWDAGQPVRANKNKRPYSAHQMMVYAQEKPIVDLAIAKSRGKRRPKHITANTRAICYAILHGVDKEAVEEFWELWIDRKEGTVFGVLDERLEKIQRNLIPDKDMCRDSIAEVLAIVFTSWNKWRSGSSISKIQITRPLTNQNFPWPR